MTTIAREVNEVMNCKHNETLYPRKRIIIDTTRRTTMGFAKTLRVETVCCKCGTTIDESAS